jgi:hypothetical protein
MPTRQRPRLSLRTGLWSGTPLIGGQALHRQKSSAGRREDRHRACTSRDTEACRSGFAGCWLRSMQHSAGHSRPASWLLGWTTTRSHPGAAGAIATRDCASWRRIAPAIACASSRQRRRASFLRSRAHVVPMHRMQRLRPSGTSAGRPLQGCERAALTALRYSRSRGLMDRRRESPARRAETTASALSYAVHDTGRWLRPKPAAPAS